MVLRFHIENEPTLPDGGPVSFAVTGKRSVDIGRDRHLDWTLPDPARLISGKHCEVHYRDGGYWLHDVSTNGTFLNGADQRMRGPHRLRSGDRLVIGHYIIGVEVDGDVAGEAQNAVPPPVDHGDLWGSDRAGPPPIDRQQLRTPREAPRPVNPEFLDWAASVPEPEVNRQAQRSVAYDRYRDEDMSWAHGARPPPPTEPPPVMPAPRRPTWTDEAPSWESGRPVAASQPSAPPAVEPRAAAPPILPPQMDAPQPPVASPPAAVAGHGGEMVSFARLLAQAAGVPESLFSGKSEAELAEQLGMILRITVESLMALLQARHQAKQMTRSTSQTTIQAIENNPLKFSPTPEDAMRILFGPPTRSYLDARSAFQQGFGDLKSHQLKTYMAMQHAVAKLIEGIDPAVMARELADGAGSTSWFGANKGKLWDAFLLRWKSHLGRDSNAPIDAFMLHFADYYDRPDKGGAK
ncbi:type VI secretion system-associated FHA domain protein TagH [Bradyrhizobium sp. 2TAF24]|uniref:type VI secretion system-associated FHA domain protein TagH n=1 Tax=Bradyrhizobium sp. 2TAF24 TaxID=3233011 RepID=UPI003F8FE02E